MMSNLSESDTGPLALNNTIFHRGTHQYSAANPPRNTGISPPQTTDIRIRTVAFPDSFWGENQSRCLDGSYRRQRRLAVCDKTRARRDHPATLTFFVTLVTPLFPMLGRVLATLFHQLKRAVVLFGERAHELGEAVAAVAFGHDAEGVD